MTRSGRPALLTWGLLPLGLALASLSAYPAYEWISAIQAGTAGDEAPIVVLPLLALAVLGLFMALVPCVLAIRRRMNPLLAPAGWYPDPSGHARERWFDGHVWSTATR